MPEIKYDYSPVPKIREFSRSDHFVRGLMGPFGSGKSTGCVIELLRRSMAQAPGSDGIKRTRWAVIRNTYPQLKDTTIKTLTQWLPPQHFGKFLPSTHDYFINKIKGVEIEIMFRALDRPEQVSNLLSLELTGAWVNEAREVPWAVIQALQGRVGRYPSKAQGGATWYGLIMDTNPPDTDSWWYRQFEEVRPDSWALFRQPSGRADNAENLGNLPKGYYSNLINSMDREAIKVYLDGEYGYVQDGKPVYPDYNDQLHCEPCKPIKGKPILRGWDFGLTPACILTQVQPSGRWLVFDEMTTEDMGIDRFSDTVLEHCNQVYAGHTFEDYGDPAGSMRAQTDERTCFDILRGKKINIQPGEQDPTSRIESVSKPLRTLIQGKPQLLLDPKCKMLRKGFQGRYQYRKIQTASERYHEKPDKNDYSHCFDGDTLIVTPLGDKRIADITEGDLVTTPHGPRRVTHITSRISDNLVEVNGTICTADHPYFTPDGIVRADALKYAITQNDVVSPLWVDQVNIQYSITIASLTIGSRQAIISPAIENMAGSTCTEMSGVAWWAKYRMAIISITRTITDQITRSRTWNALNQLITRSTILNLMLCQPHVLMQRHYGTVQNWGLNGIANTEKNHGLAGKRSHITAFSAEVDTKQYAGHERWDIVRPNVSLKPVEIPALMMSQGDAIVVRPNSSLTVTPRRVFVQRRVYDITVDEAHCYYANGMLVHNCHDALQYVATKIFLNKLKSRDKRVKNKQPVFHAI